MTAAGRTYWQTLEELADSPEFAAAVAREAPRFKDVIHGFDRRRFLQLMAASIALGGLSGCGPEANPRQLLPYVEEPDNVIPGRDRFFATAVTQNAFTGDVVAGPLTAPAAGNGRYRYGGGFPTSTWQQSNYFVDYSVVLAGVLLSTIPLLILFAFAGKQLVSGIMAGAVKG